MALQIRQSRGARFGRFISVTLMMVALVAQPMYGLVKGQVANAAEGIRAISVSNMYFGKKYSFLDYIGTSFTTSGFASTEVSSVKVDLLSGDQVVISNVGKAEDVNNLISNTASRTISVPFYIPTANTLTGSWTTTSYTWKKADRPTGVKVTIETVDGAVITGENNNDVLSNSDFESKLLQAPAAAPVITGLEQGQLLSGSDLPLSVSWSKPSRTSLFEYRITKDGGEYVSGRTAERGMVLSGLESGEYGLQIRGLSGSHMEGPWSQVVNFTVDVTGPSATIESVTLDGKSVYSANGAEITLKASDKNGLNRYDLTLWEDGTRVSGASPLFSKSGVIGSDNDDEFSLSFNLPANLDLGDGHYTIYYTVKDRAGISVNATDMKFTVDTIAPEISIVNMLNGQLRNKVDLGGKIVNVNLLPGKDFRILTNEDGILEITLPNGAKRTLTAGQSKNNQNLGWSMNGGDGEYSFVKIDAAGNRSNPVVVTIDTAAPVVAVLDIEDGKAYNAPVDVVASIKDANLSHYYLKVWRDGVEIKPSGAWTTKRTGEFTAQTLAQISGDGNYVVKLEAADKAGNKDGTSADDGDSVKTVAFTIDTIAPPAPVITGDLTDSSSTSRTISGTAEPGATVVVSLSGVDDPQQTTADENGNWKVTFTGLTRDRTYQVSAVASDTAGNASTAATAEFTVLPTIFPPLAPASPLGGGGPQRLIPSASGQGGFANVFTLPGESTQDALGSTSVLGAQTDRSGGSTIDQPAVLPTAEGWKVFGLLWYWWLLIAAAVAGLWWMITAARRRKQDDAAI